MEERPNGTLAKTISGRSPGLFGGKFQVFRKIFSREFAVNKMVNIFVARNKTVLADRLMVGQKILVLLVRVRILVGQQK